MRVEDDPERKVHQRRLFHSISIKKRRAVIALVFRYFPASFEKEKLYVCVCILKQREIDFTSPFFFEEYDFLTSLLT
jgi:hypothetical protein